jgi:hypothetical protein
MNQGSGTRHILFDSMASAAASLRSKCGSVRRPPECNKQRRPGGTPHVGQGTEENSLGVRSRILTRTGYEKKSSNTVRFGTLRRLSLGNFRSCQLAVGSKAPALHRANTGEAIIAQKIGGNAKLAQKWCENRSTEERLSHYCQQL